MERHVRNFGQKVDLCTRIKDVLKSYPEATVLKEMIQNADDAGATTFNVMLDLRQHKADRLAFPQAHSFQGPAILVYNDAPFTDRDLESIQHIGGSQKALEHGRSKTGRFGVGFNSVYHLTDMPSFLSRDFLVVLDPHCKYLPDASHTDPGKLLSFKEAGVVECFSDTFEPYRVFGCDLQSTFKGTIFRLPLRTKEHASESRISNRPCTVDSAKMLLYNMVDQLSDLSLFLTSVAELRVSIWKEDAIEPQVLRSLQLTDVDTAAPPSRDALHNAFTLVKGDVKKLEPFTSTWRFDLHLSGAQTAERWLVVQTMGGGSALKMCMDPSVLAHGLQPLPWAGVAARLVPHGGVIGKSYCLLPLPSSTGLPIHVNGFFEVSINRRDIWWGEDGVGAGRIRSEWNETLLIHVVAPSYIQLLMEARDHSRREDYFSLWPTRHLADPWGKLVKSTYTLALDVPVLWSNASGGRWVSAVEGIFDGDKDEGLPRQLRALLERCGLPLVAIPVHVREMLLEAAAESGLRLSSASPGFVRQWLRKDPSWCREISQEEGEELLRYCLRGISADDMKELCGLKIAPLACGGFAAFASSGDAAPPLVICEESERQIFSPRPLLEVRASSAELTVELKRLAATRQTNLIKFDATLLPALMPSILPVHWRGQQLVRLSAVSQSEGGEPDLSWILFLWELLGRATTPVDLSLFAGWPLLPGQNGQVYALPMGGMRTSRMINLVDLGDEVLREALGSVGCISLHPRIDQRSLSLLRAYVPSLTICSVLRALNAVLGDTGESLNALFKEVSLAHRSALRRMFSDRHPLEEKELSADPMLLPLLRALPIYEVYSVKEASAGKVVETNALRDAVSEGVRLDANVGELNSASSAKPEEFSNVVAIDAGFHRLPPVGAQSSLLDGRFVKCDSESEAGLMRVMGILRLRLSAFYGDHVFGRLETLEAAERDEMMTSVLRNLHSLSLEDDNFIAQLRDLAFVPVASGKLRRPGELFHPKVKEVATLLDGDEILPCGLFAEDDVLSTLERLGMRSSMSRGAILESARSIERLAKDEPDAAHWRAQALLRYVDDHFASLNEVRKSEGGNKKITKFFPRFSSSRVESEVLDASVDEFNFELMSLAWLPIIRENPEQYLPWQTEVSFLPTAAATDVRPKEDAWLVSASLHLLDGEVRSDTLRRLFRWHEPPPLHSLATQLTAISTFESIRDQSHQQSMAIAIPMLYRALERNVSSADCEFHSDIFEHLRDQACVWIGCAFVRPNECAFNSTIALEPYLYVVPADLQCFGSLLRKIGVHEHFDSSQLLSLLGQLAKQGKALSAQDLELSIGVSQLLASTEYQPLPLNCVVYLPDRAGYLVAASNLMLDDAPWLGDSSLGVVVDAAGDATGVEVCLAAADKWRRAHPKLSFKVAESLGAVSMRRWLIARNADTLSLGTAETVEAFGQHESLTSRLRNILELYADGIGILYEMIQNADDAGATEIAFMLDEVDHGTTSLLAGQMSAWQGPALCCYNNATFTQNDLQNICRIGSSSKMAEAAATGRFGLGFNTVYHLTDVPSFVSGSHIVIFDPHARYLPGASPSSPGLKILFEGEPFLDQFPDQFRPYILFGCDMKSRFNGTLFRLPLRMAAKAATSNISQHPYTPSDVYELLRKLDLNAGDLLIFLKHIRSIKIFHRKTLGIDPQLIFHAQRRATSGTPSVEKIKAFVRDENLNDPSRTRIKQNIKNDESVYERLRRTDTQALPKEALRMTITVKPFEATEYLEIIEDWLVCSSFGCGAERLKSMCVSDEGRRLKLLPWGGVAARLSRRHRQLVRLQVCDIDEASVSPTLVGSSPDSGIQVTVDSSGNDQIAENNLGLSNAVADSNMDSNLDREAVADSSVIGRSFCFLPLPSPTSLPIHLNGYFELSANRRDIWHGTDMTGAGKLRSEWNHALLVEVVAPSYVQMLLYARNILNERQDYFSLWPTRHLADPWGKLVKSTYTLALDVPVLWSNASGGRWVSAVEGIFDGDKDEGLPRQLRALLERCGLPLVAIPVHVREMLLEAAAESGLRLSSASPGFVRQWLRKDPSWCREISQEEGEELLRYCLRGISADDMKELCGLKIAPLACGGFAAFASSGDAAPPLVICEESERQIFSPRPLLEVRASSAELTVELKRLAATRQTNLIKFDATLLPALMPSILPVHWRGQQLVRLSAVSQSEGGEPDLSWILFLWELLGRATTPVDLSLFAGWPLLPGQNGQVYALPMGGMRTSRMINLVDLGDEVLREALGSVGCISLHPRIDQRSLSLLRAYVPSLTICSVLRALNAVLGDTGESLNALFKEVSLAHRSALRRMFSDRHPLEEKELSADPMLLPLLRALPIYEVYSVKEASAGKVVETNALRDAVSEGVRLDANVGELNSASSAKPEEFSNVVAIDAGFHRLPPVGAQSSLLDGRFVKCDSESEAGLMRVMGILRLRLSAFYGDHVFGRLETLEAAERDEMMTSVLRNLHSLSLEDDNFIAQLRDLAFVPVASGKLRRPGELFHPKVKEVATLLDGDEILPCGLFAEDDVLSTLERLGMRSSMSRGAILESARSIARLAKDEPDAARRRGRALFAFVDTFSMSDSVNCFENDDDDFEDSLSSIAWLPALCSPPVFGMPWREDIAPVVAPNAPARPVHEAWLVSHCCPLLDMRAESPLLHRVLNWDEPPRAAIICAQLVELASSHSSGSLKFEDESSQHLSGCLGQIYDRLQQLVDDIEFTGVKTALKGRPCIWAGESCGFLPPTQVAFGSRPLSQTQEVSHDDYDTVPRAHEDGSATPTPPFRQIYLGYVPHLLHRYVSLFLALGVRDKFVATDYCKVLTHVARDKGTSEPLDASSLDECIAHLRVAASEVAHGHDILSDYYFLPDKRGVLRPAAELIFDDAPWMTMTSVSDDLGTQVGQFVHPLVDGTLARKLGSQSKRQLMSTQQKCADNIPIPTADIVSVSLTSSLYLLLDILELVDSFGGSAVHFCLDWRSHDSQSLLSSRCAPFQREALCIYIPEIHLSSEQICMLHRPSSVVGYHLAQTPGRIRHSSTNLLSLYAASEILTIVSGDSAFVCDPSGTYLDPRHMSSSALADEDTASSLVGRPPVCHVYPMVPGDLPRRFPHQFAPLAMWEFDPFCGTPLNGTLIRLPLRCSQLAANSRLHKTPTTPENIRSLFADFKFQATAALLALENVVSVSTSEWLQCESAPIRTFANTLSTHAHEEKPRGALARDESWRRQSIVGIFAGVFGKQQSRREHIFTVDVSTWSRDLKPLIDMGSRLEDGPDLHQGEQSSTSVGPSFADEIRHTSRYLLSEAIAMGHSRSIALHPQNVARGLVPYVCVAVLVSRDGSAAISPGIRQDESCLGAPMPIKTLRSGLPIHLFGRFEHSGANREIPFAEGEQAVERWLIDWNRSLLCCASAAYGALLRALPRIFSKDSAYFSDKSHVTRQMYDCWPLLCQLSSNEIAKLLVVPLYADLAASTLFLAVARDVEEEEKPKMPQLRKLEDGFLLPHGINDRVSSFMRQHFTTFELPAQLATDILSCAPTGVRPMRPQEMRAYLRRKLTDTKKRERRLRLQSWCALHSSAFVLDLLAYCASDMQGSNVSSSRRYNDLEGLLLLPLASGGIQTLGSLLELPSGRYPFLLATARQQQMLPHMRNRFVSPLCTSHEEACRLFSDEYFMRAMILEHLPLQVFAFEMRGIPMDPSHEWLQDLWAAVAECCRRDQHGNDTLHSSNAKLISTLGACRFLPLEDGRIVPVRELKTCFVCSRKTGALELFALPRAETVVNRAAAAAEARNRAVQINHQTLDDLKVEKISLAHLLRKLCIPMLDHKFVALVPPRENDFASASNAEDASHETDSSAELQGLFVPDATTEGEIVRAILSKIAGLQSEEGKCRWDVLAYAEAQALVSFFAIHLDKYKTNESLANTTRSLREVLKSLVIFESLAEIEGKGPLLVSLESGPKFILPTTHPFFTPETSPYSGDFLRADVSDTIMQLYRWMGARVLLDADVLEKFVLPNFPTMSLEQQRKVRNHVLESWSELSACESLKSVIKETPFIPSGTSLLRPRDVLDPRDDLLTCVFRGDERFPDAEYCSEQWLSILSATGMKTKVDHEAIQFCAIRVAERSKEAVETMTATPLDAVSRGALLTAHLTQHIVELEECAAADGVDLCAKLRGVPFVPARKPPSGGDGATYEGEIVLASFDELGLEMDRQLLWTSTPLLREEWTPPPSLWSPLGLQSPPPGSAVYRHAANICGAGTTDAWQWSDQTPEGVFSALWKYLMEQWHNLTPDMTTAFRRLPLALCGTAIVPVSRLLCECPAEMRPMLQPLDALSITPTPPKTFLTSLGMRERPQTQHLIQLLCELPHNFGWDCETCHSDKLAPPDRRALLSILRVAVGDPSFRRHSDIGVLTACGGISPLSHVVIDDVRHMSARLDPSAPLQMISPAFDKQMCSRLGVRRLSELVKEELCEQVEPLEEALAERLTTRMHSEQVVNFVFNTLLVCHRNQGADREVFLPDLDAKRVRSELTKRKVVLVRRLRTRLVLSSSSQVIGRQVSVTHLVTVDTIYIAAESIGSLTIEDALQRAICDSIGVLYLPELAPIFREEGSVVYSPPPIFTSWTAAVSRCEPGTAVAETDKTFLHPTPLRALFEGEVVAIDLPDGEGDNLSYGVVEKNRSPGHDVRDPVAVLCSHDGKFIPVAPLRIYTFRSTIRYGDTDARITLSSEIDAPAVQQRALVPGSVDVASIDSANLSAAVVSVLAAANIPTSLEQNLLLERNFQLQTQLDTARAELSIAVTQGQKVAHELDELKEANTCQICINRRVDALISPCGHLICRQCVPRCAGRCPFCRGDIEGAHNFYAAAE